MTNHRDRPGPCWRQIAVRSAKDITMFTWRGHCRDAAHGGELAIQAFETVRPVIGPGASQAVARTSVVASEDSNHDRRWSVPNNLLKRKNANKIARDVEASVDDAIVALTSIIAIDGTLRGQGHTLHVSADCRKDGDMINDVSFRASAYYASDDMTLENHHAMSDETRFILAGLCYAKASTRTNTASWSVEGVRDLSGLRSATLRAAFAADAMALREAAVSKLATALEDLGLDKSLAGGAS